jgi:hypothetical protein
MLTKEEKNLKKLQKKVYKIGQGGPKSWRKGDPWRLGVEGPWRLRFLVVRFIGGCGP